MSLLPFSPSVPDTLHNYTAFGYKTLAVDEAFPFKVIGDLSCNPWPYLRRDIPHYWYVDSRYPTVGFLSHDEAHILYNTALQFAGQHALEIGCWMGWSSAHLAAAGVLLDVVDPVLAKPDFLDSLTHAMAHLGTSHRVNICPHHSPDAVKALAQAQAKQWSLAFIDGNHNRPGPLLDAKVVHQFIAADALVLFHDLTSPHVSEGLDFLKSNGWHTAIYHTMQVMGVAWRGNVQPIAHTPDPTIQWALPAHLQGFEVMSAP
jgi:hypothetical protein